jgi:hypothetical protein
MRRLKSVRLGKANGMAIGHERVERGMVIGQKRVERAMVNSAKKGRVMAR